MNGTSCICKGTLKIIEKTGKETETERKSMENTEKTPEN